ncbi:glutamine--fructose-6-phosphate transaminase (isomerizing) [Lentisphaerota bacterium WC36G]|nr:glutamine--fructose-6-phosphate transaminase (isomerizing) [Lentisphaerae bacterium WC36]
MCGIVGYVGDNYDISVVVEGLKRLEYRGYDSAGLACVNIDNSINSKNEIKYCKSVGKVGNLQQKIFQEYPNLIAADSNFKSNQQLNVIAHTRWATHGEPSTINAHPHLDTSEKFAIVHNGIIENYENLREHLIAQDFTFKSETDSEVIANLISYCYEGDFFAAVASAVKKLQGTYGIAVISTEKPDEIIVASKGSPIAIGLRENDKIIASDVVAIAAYTKQVIYLSDDDIAIVTSNNIEIRNVDNVVIEREKKTLDWDIESVSKGEYAHFMLKEIFEQPQVLANSVRGRYNLDLATANLAGLNLTAQDIVRLNRIVIAACGTSLNAGLLGEYYFEDLAHIPTEVDQAAEFRYRNPIIEVDSLVLAVSQSGETADTLAAVNEAINKGAIVAAICNSVGSTIARRCGRGVYLHAGVEVSVASTKAFTCQSVVMLLMALMFGRCRRLNQQTGQDLIAEIIKIPQLVEEVLAQSDEIHRIAKKYVKCCNFLYIGRGYLYPVALEGALKLKEISYIHAEGYHAAELKHGPIALLCEDTPVMALANKMPGKDKVIGNIQECLARKAPVVVTATKNDADIEKLAVDDVIWLPEASVYTTPIITAVALQLFSYFVALERGCEIDQPRNLAKSVTVE